MMLVTFICPDYQILLGPCFILLLIINYNQRKHQGKGNPISLLNEVHVCSLGKFVKRHNLRVGYTE